MAPPGEVQDQNRRVIRTADLWLETDAPEAAGVSIAELATAKGGFVLSLDTGRSRADDGEETTTVTAIVRVPAPAFDAALEQVRRIGKHVSSEKVTGQDVTDEYVDVEARIKAQRVVEDQYLSVLRAAKTIHDILEVQQKLGDVRTEIDRAEGRRRLLESQTSLSTITAHLSQHIEAMEASGPGFGTSVRRAAHDAREVSIAIVNGTIRAAGVLVPLVALVGVPMWLLLRWFWSRCRRLTRA